MLRSAKVRTQKTPTVVCMITVSHITSCIDTVGCVGVTFQHVRGLYSVYICVVTWQICGWWTEGYGHTCWSDNKSSALLSLVVDLVCYVPAQFKLFHDPNGKGKVDCPPLEQKKNSASYFFVIKSCWLYWSWVLGPWRVWSKICLLMTGIKALIIRLLVLSLNQACPHL